MEIKDIERNQNFVPEFNGNKKLESGQVSVFIQKFPTVTEISSYKKFAFDKNSSIELRYNDELLITSCVGRISNLTVSGKKIESGKQLAQSECQALAGLVSEIREYLLDDGGVLDQGE